MTADDGYGDMAPLEVALYELMSMVSEDCWCAGWNVGTEFAVWDLARGARTEWGQGPNEATEPLLDAIASLSEHIDRWIVWSAGPKAVTVAEFEAAYNAQAVAR